MYTTSGPVRGTCNHTHKTIQGAHACARRDSRAVKHGNPGIGAYSDREVVRQDGARLSAEEAQALEDCGMAAAGL